MIEVTHMLGALLLLSVIDAATTYYALTKIEGAYEVNKLMAKVMEKIGLIPALGLKLVIAIIAINGLAQLPVTSILYYGVAVVTLGYLVLVGNNLRVILRNRNG